MTNNGHRVIYKPQHRAIEQDDGTWNIYQWYKPWFRAGRWRMIANGVSMAIVQEVIGD